MLTAPVPPDHTESDVLIARHTELGDTIDQLYRDLDEADTIAAWPTMACRLISASIESALKEQRSLKSELATLGYACRRSTCEVIEPRGPEHLVYGARNGWCSLCDEMLCIECGEHPRSVGDFGLCKYCVEDHRDTREDDER